MGRGGWGNSEREREGGSWSQKLKQYYGKTGGSAHANMR